MKLSIQWLKEILPGLKAPAAKIADQLARVGFEIESQTEVKGDTVLELALPANRGDVLSHYGLAVEVAALFGLKLPVWSKTKIKTSFKPKGLRVALKDKKGCLRYVSRIVNKVGVGPSPQWLADRLESLGVRPVNNIVDATNYVMMERGHPLHAFDARLVKGGKIEIRKAGGAVDFKTLDHENRRLEADDLVIADQAGPVALAGIMGGENSEIQNDTTDVILEAAAFAPDRIRKTARRLGLHTDSSHRFERFVNPETVALAMERVTELILQTAGGTASALIDLYPSRLKAKTVTLRLAKVSELLGFAVPLREVQRLLSSLGLKFKASQGTLKVTVPSSRSDLEREIDLIEEVVRYLGFDRIPSALPPTVHRPIRESDESRHGEEIRRFFASHGFWETIHYSFTSPEEISKLGYDLKEVPQLRNPISADLAYLRPTLLGGLLQTLQASLKENAGGRFFEIRTVFSAQASAETSAEAEAPAPESRRLTAVYTGSVSAGQWRPSPQKSDLFVGKGIIDEFADTGRIDARWEKGETAWTHPGQTLLLKSARGDSLGFLGRLHPDLSARFDLPQEVYAVDLDYSLLASLWLKTPPVFRAYTPFPRVERDMALVVDAGLAYSDLEKAIRAMEVSWLKKIRLFDVYEGDKIPAGKKSVAIKLIYENPDRTLTDEEVNAAHFSLVDRLKTTLGAALR